MSDYCENFQFMGISYVSTSGNFNFYFKLSMSRCLTAVRTNDSFYSSFYLQNVFKK